MRPLLMSNARVQALRVLALAPVLALALIAATSSAFAETVFRVRPATEAEIKAVSLRTGAALFVEAVPASVTALAPGDLLAFADATPLSSIDALAEVAQKQNGKPVDVLFYRGKSAQLASVAFTPQMFPPRSKPAAEEKPAEPPKIVPSKQVEPAKNESKPRVEPTQNGTTSPVETIRFKPPDQTKSEVKPETPRLPETPRPPANETRASAAKPAKFSVADWTIDPPTASGAILEEGGMLLYAGTRDPSVAESATRRARVSGDFELSVDYDILDWDPVEAISCGFGLQVASTPDWKGDRIVTLERVAGQMRDHNVAGNGREELRVDARPQRNRASLRIRRTGDTWRFASLDRDRPAGGWVELGELTAHLAPEVVVRIAAQVSGPNQTQVLVRDVRVEPVAPLK